MGRTKICYTNHSLKRDSWQSSCEVSSGTAGLRELILVPKDALGGGISKIGCRVAERQAETSKLAFFAFHFSPLSSFGLARKSSEAGSWAGEGKVGANWAARERERVG